MPSDAELEHPGLKRFNAPLEFVKHVAKKALKWAAIGALVGGILVAAVPGLFGGLAAGAAALFGAQGLANAAAWGVAKSFITGAVAVGGLSGIIGALSGAAEAGDAVEDRKEQVIAAFERGEARELKVAAIRQRQENTRLTLADRAQGMGCLPWDWIPTNTV